MTAHDPGRMYDTPLPAQCCATCRCWERRGYTWGHCTFHCGVKAPFQVTGEEDVCPSWQASWQTPQDAA